MTPSLVRARWSPHFVSARCRCQSGRHRVWLWGKTRRGGEAARGSVRGDRLGGAASALVAGLGQQLGDDSVGPRVEDEADVGAADLVIERMLRLQAVPPVDHAVVSAG